MTAKKASPTLFLARWETRNFWWLAVGATEQDARDNLGIMWADWCADGDGDVTLPTDHPDEVMIEPLHAGLMMRDWSPYTGLWRSSWETPCPVTQDGKHCLRRKDHDPVFPHRFE